MSYNIDTHQIVAGGNLTLTGAQIVAFRELELPEDNGFCGYPKVVDLEATYDFVPRWRGTWSGNSHDTLLKTILPATKGSADIIYTWEGGDAFSGVRVVDGVVTEHAVVMVLGEQAE